MLKMAPVAFWWNWVNLYQVLDISMTSLRILIRFTSPPAVPISPREPPPPSKAVRPDLKIGAVVLPVLPLHTNRLLSSWRKRPTVFHPCYYSCQSIISTSLPTMGPILLAAVSASWAFRANAKVTFTQSSSAKWANWTALPLCVLHPPFTVHLHKHTSHVLHLSPRKLLKRKRKLLKLLSGPTGYY